MANLGFNIPEGLAQQAAGAALVAGAVFGIGTIATGAEHLDDKAVVYLGEAKPSDTTSVVFDNGKTLAELAGVLAVGIQGAAMIRRSRDGSDKAKGELSHRIIGGSRYVAPLTLAAGVTVGALVGIQNGIEHAQTDVMGEAFGDLGGGNGEMQVLSNSSAPQSLSASHFPSVLATPFMQMAQKEGVPVMPIRFAWRTANMPTDAASVQVFTAGLPQEVTGLLSADKECKVVPVAAAKEIGVKKGETFDLEGIKLTVERVIENGAGMNLLPVIFNNADYAKCLDSDPNEPYSAILAKGDKERLMSILEEIGVNTGESGPVADRVFVVPTEEFLKNTKSTVKSNVDGLVLEAILLAAIFAGGALSNDARTELANNRRNNMFLIANGLSWKELKSMYESRSRERALASSLAAAPLILLVDGMSNLTMAGASMGPDIRTVLSVVGLTYGTSKIGTVIAIRREKKAASGDEEHAL